MRRVAVVVLALVLLCALSAHADEKELSKEEHGWVVRCVERLDADSADVAAGAGDALRRFGLRAVPAIVAGTKNLKTDRGWERLEHVLRSFGARKAVAKLKSQSIPSRVRARMMKLVQGLQKLQPDVDEAVAQEIEELLEHLRETNTYSSNDPGIRRIVAIGRPAVPALLRILWTSDNEHGGFYHEAAADALARLAEEQDLPALAALVEDGVLLAARCFKNLRGDKARDALLVPVRRGFMDHDLQQALERYLGDEVTRAALREYLKQYGEEGGQETGWVAKLLAKAGDEKALPLLRKLLPLVESLAARGPIAGAITELGGKDGIRELIDVVAAGEGNRFEIWHCQEAGRALNRIVGKRVFRGKSGPFAVDSGNFAEAAEAFRKWWKENESKLVYQRTYRRWRIKE